MKHSKLMCQFVHDIGPSRTETNVNYLNIGPICIIGCFEVDTLLKCKLLILIRRPWKSQMSWAAICSVRYWWENKADCGYWYIFVWTLLTMKIAFFCGVILCRFLDKYQEFGGMYCLFLQGRIFCCQISPLC
jgi:hypothetical protein